MSEQVIVNNYHEFPYGIWLPFENNELIKKMKRFIRIHVESTGYTMLYLNGKRVRTPRESGSHPCYNCGHCIDNGFSACRNKKCVKDRIKRKLCNGNSWRGRERSWIHDVEKDCIIHRNKKGINFSFSWCKVCHEDIKWLGDYPQDEHIKEYFNRLKGLGEIPLENYNNKIYFQNSQKKYQGFSIIKTKKTFTVQRTASGELRHLVFIRDNYRCVECGATNKETSLEIDHKIPWSKGGKTELDNLQTLCKTCNRAKHARIWENEN